MVNTKTNLNVSADEQIDLVELKGFSRSVAELEWLLLILVILYLVVPGNMAVSEAAIIKAALGFGLFVLGFRYLNFYRLEARWKLGIEIWAMVIFITVVLWYSGKVHSPLLNLYLLVIITSGLTMGKLSTVFILAAISGAYLFMGYPSYFTADFSIEQFGVIMSVFAPYLLMAYLVTMLSADLHYAKKMFKQLSETDDMTGLDNLRSFKNTLGTEILKSERYKHVFSVVMLDADGLKQINDRYGHDAGNTLIKNVANSVKSCLRESDTLARYGGDEFIILLPETEGQAAIDAGERIRTAVENTTFDLEGEKISTTVSIGIAGFPEHAQRLDDLMSKADRALYHSKAAGRNSVSMYAPDMD